MAGLIQQYYAWLSGLSNSLSSPISGLADSLNLPVASAFLFGVLGAVAPCQLSASAAALAFVTRDIAGPSRVWGRALAYAGGKATVYLILGALFLTLGLSLSQFGPTAIPIVQAARRAIGPLMVIVGLVMVGILRPRWSLGSGVSRWVEAKAAGGTGILPVFLLGIAFSFTFCPTLFWLFFGLTIPLALASPAGFFLPGVFAFGTAVPVLLLAGVAAVGHVDVRRALRRVRAADVWIQRLAGVVFVLIGLHETVLYWLL